ncbi:hypothetical protein [Pseudomonas sp. NFACC42-2]|uniref:hypothetical protein n=1 Tax=Pseudomonas sp. NFACC42-2 TaxID=1566193 RepID=UPI0008E55B09|nr:hypothetical protein [Pseudomonas sp. NFACC42-2]SFS27672.1 hypothetical protein SAMN03159318_03977 [Pseudomonas sp. NFACC42-2]
MIIGEPDIFEVGDPVIDQCADDRRVGLVIAIEFDSTGEKVLVVETDGRPGEIWRVLDKDAVLP